MAALRPTSRRFERVRQAGLASARKPDPRSEIRAFRARATQRRVPDLDGGVVVHGRDVRVSVPIGSDALRQAESLASVRPNASLGRGEGATSPRSARARAVRDPLGPPLPAVAAGHGCVSPSLGPLSRICAREPLYSRSSTRLDRGRPPRAPRTRHRGGLEGALAWLESTRAALLREGGASVAPPCGRSSQGMSVTPCASGEAPCRPPCRIRNTRGRRSPRPVPSNAAREPATARGFGAAVWLFRWARIFARRQDLVLARDPLRHEHAASSFWKLARV